MVRITALLFVVPLMVGVPASAGTITRDLEISLGSTITGTFGSGQGLSQVAEFFSDDPFVFDVGDTLIFNIYFDQRLQVFDFGDPTLEAFSFSLDNGVGTANSFNGTLVSSIEALGPNGNIWLGPLTLGWQASGGGFGWGAHGIDITGTQGSFTGIRWTTQLTSANEGAPLTLSAFSGVQMQADGIRLLPLTPVPEPSSLLLLGIGGLGSLVKLRRRQRS